MFKVSKPVLYKPPPRPPQVSASKEGVIQMAGKLRDEGSLKWVLSIKRVALTAHSQFLQPISPFHLSTCRPVWWVRRGLL